MTNLKVINISAISNSGEERR